MLQGRGIRNRLRGVLHEACPARHQAAQQVASGKISAALPVCVPVRSSSADRDEIVGPVQSWSLIVARWFGEFPDWEMADDLLPVVHLGDPDCLPIIRHGFDESNMPDLIASERFPLSHHGRDATRALLQCAAPS